jgi:Asp-tRNA(Asn)/Glu-tRNA(Gln) amidotransferase A subunit family amidase
MPMGLQLTGPLFAERALLGAANAYEQATRHAGAHAPQIGGGVR